MALRSRSRQRSRGWFFRTKQPHHFTWIVAFLLAIVGIVSTRVHVDYVSANALWVVAAAYLVLALGTVIDGL